MTFKLGHTTRRGQGFGIKWMREHVNYAGDDCLFWPLSHSDGYGSVSYHGKIYRARSTIQYRLYGGSHKARRAKLAAPTASSR